MDETELVRLINVIAELGVNWNTLETAKDMIKAAKDAGASHVKFQLFNKETIKDSPHREQLLPLILSEGKIKHLHNHAEKQKIGFILTPMYLDAVDLAVEYADYIKIRYADHENKTLIGKAYDTGKTLLISVPYRPLNVYSPRKKFLYNLPDYPPKVEDFNLEVAASCHGFSSHFPHTICDLAYAINRSFEECFIEKHVMLSIKEYSRYVACMHARHNLMQTPPPPPHTYSYVQQFPPIDEKVSVTFLQLKNFIEQCSIVERMKRIRL